MTRKVVTTHPEASAWEAAALLDKHHVKRLPVTGALGRLEGVIARSDLLRLMAPSDADLATRVRRALVGINAAASAQITPSVGHGVVLLAGQTRDWGFKTTGVAMVRQIPGVRRVHDEIAYVTPKVRLYVDSPDAGRKPSPPSR